MIVVLIIVLVVILFICVLVLRSTRKEDGNKKRGVRMLSSKKKSKYALQVEFENEKVKNTLLRAVRDAYGSVDTREETSHRIVMEFSAYAQPSDDTIKDHFTKYLNAYSTPGKFETKFISVKAAKPPVNLESKMKFYSQHGQDKFVYKRFFKDKKTPGVFLEIGADDGIRFSNCKFFEETLKWTGLAIEARPSAFKKLKANRSCICENVVLSNVEEETQFMDISGYGLGLSGLVNKYDPKHQKRISKEIKNKENKGFKIVDVQTVTLNNILDKHNISNVDFLSIDTEGSELDILSTLDFSKYNIDVITIEDNYNDSELINFFEQRDYSLVEKIECDKIFQKNITKLSNSVAVFFDCTWRGCNSREYKLRCDNSTPSSKGHWKNIRSTANVDKADYIIGMDGLSKKKYKKKKFIILPREPFGKYNSFYEDTIHAVVFTQQDGCLSYDEAKNLEYESRNKLCSMIVSSKSRSQGIYKKRVAFAKEVDKTKLVDIFGKGWKNDLKNSYIGELKEKKEGLLDYKYSICIENSKTKNYFSEKITEALLCLTMPIYCGCPNILEYFPEDSLYVIDIEKENVMDDVREILKKPITDKHVAAMKEARRLILEKYNLFEVVREKIKSIRN